MSQMWVILGMIGCAEYLGMSVWLKEVREPHKHYILEVIIPWLSPITKAFLLILFEVGSRSIHPRRAWCTTLKNDWHRFFADASSVSGIISVFCDTYWLQPSLQRGKSGSGVGYQGNSSSCCLLGDGNEAEAVEVKQISSSLAHLFLF